MEHKLLLQMAENIDRLGKQRTAPEPAYMTVKLG